MSQTTISPQTERATMLLVPVTVVLAVAMVSFSSLLLELAMTRLFSVVLFYHFAFFAISVALLGLGSGGVFAHIRRQWLLRFDVGSMGALICILSSLAIPGVVWIVLHTPVSLQVTAANFGRLTVIYLATAVPFFFTGLLFSVLFARSTGAISILYGADLAGGALACLAVVPLLNTIGAPDSLLFCSVVLSMAAALWAGSRKIGRLARAFVVVTVIFLVWSHFGHKMDVIYAKGLLRDPKWVEFSKWNAISRIEVNNQHGSRYVVIDADATSAIMNVDPVKWDQDQPASPADADPRACSSSEECIIACPAVRGCCGWPCGCTNAVHRDRVSSFTAHYASTCTRTPNCPVVACAYEPATGAVCRAGRCEAERGW